MKRIILTLIVLHYFCIAGYSQNNTVYNCNGIAVTTQTNTELTPEIKAQNRASALAECGTAIYGARGISAADILDEPTFTYNCFGYAFHMTEGNANNKVWIMDNSNLPGNPQKYYDHPPIYLETQTYTDGCFVETTNVGEAVKIVYRLDNQAGAPSHIATHAGVVDGSSGKIISKWGNSILVRHYPEINPYHIINNSLYHYHYYKRKTPEISGNNTTICSNASSSYTVKNPPPGYSWGKSDNLNNPSISGRTASFTAKNNVSGTGSVSIKNSSGTNLATKNIWVGVPSSINISGPTSPSLYTY